MDADQTEQAEKAEKSRLADLKMAEMRKKNELLMKRHEEIEADKRNANLSSKMAGLKLNDVETEQHQERRPAQVKGRGYAPGREQQQQRTSVGRGAAANRSPNQLPDKIQENAPPPDPKFNYLDDPGRKGDYNNYQQQQQRPNFRGRGFAKSQSFDVENRPRVIPGGVGRGVMTKKDMELAMTGSERLNYQNWLNERTKIDAERMTRQQTSSGEWRREWDAEKSAKNRENELPCNQRGDRRGVQPKRQNFDAPGREFDQKFDNNQRGEYSKRQESRDVNQGGNNYRDNRRPRRYSDSEDQPISSFRGTGRGFNAPRTSPGGGQQGFSVFPANSGGNLPPRSPRIDVDTVKFSIREASNQGQGSEGFGSDNNRYRDNRHQYQQNRGGGRFEPNNRGRNENNRGARGDRANFQRSGNLRNSDRQMQQSRGFSSNGSDGATSQNNGVTDKRLPQRRNEQASDNKSSKVYSRRTLSYEGADTSPKADADRQPSESAGVWTTNQTSAAAPEENWDEEAAAAAATVNQVKGDHVQVVEEEDDQWEDVDEEDDPSTGLRRRAISEEYRRPLSEGRQEDDGEEDEEEEFAEPEEYGAYDHQGSEQYEEAANDQPYDDEQAASLMDDSRQRNESMDQIEREMIATLNENIEAAEAALGKHDEDLDVILYGARVDRDIEPELHAELSPTSYRAIEVPNVNDVDVEVKLCVETLLTCVN